MEMLYIKREGTYSINLKTDLVKYSGCYDSMISYIHKVLLQFPVGVPWRRVYVSMEGDRRHNICYFFIEFQP